MNVMDNKDMDKFQVILRQFAILTMLVFFLYACTNKAENTKTIISVSILPQKYFVEKIAGDHFEINVLIPPGASPATYDPTPSQLIELSKSQIFFKIGYIEFEKNWLDKIVREYPQLNIIDNSIGINLIENQQYDSDHGHHHGFIEPHIWMSPENVKVIANSIYQSILSLDRENESYYTNNYNQFISEIDSLDCQILEKLQNISSRSFIIYHPALTYYAKAYNLQQIPIEIEGKNPSAFHVKQIIDTAKSQHIKIVFIQKQFDQDKAKTIAQEINGSVIPIDPLDYNWHDQLLAIADALTQTSNTSRNE